MHINCLIVDDEVELAKMTAEYFNMFDVKTEYVDSARSCFDFLKENSADLILLDINLGDGSGFEVCKKVREEYQLPILFISARQSDDDVLVALSIGGDDYIKKPYSLSVLLAKVKVNLKRVEQLNQALDSSESKLSGSDANASDGADDSKSDILSLDEPTMSVILRGERISLKAKEFALLKCLYAHKNTIVTKDTLFDEVWGDAFYSDGTLNVHIRKLREKMENDPNNPEFIKTIWGTGYILEL
ncbi:DNA-binding response regulator, OmpR family, contains REC and winged-helix (wHTH) domain [Lachnospiraceae bacterium NE2001]|nr:DNA-binding response regulator, OmpR family, contains REC and winged-helix (wHTH) domain [Lachnospiraceae bacterium NE2001]